MPRIELWMTLGAGLAGGLAGVLWSGLVTTPWLERAGRADPAPLGSAADVLAGAALRAVAGAALGLLFWLGWGLIAVVGWSWYAIGVLYGGLVWAALVAPTLGTLLLRSREPSRVVAAHATEWLVTCLTIGLLCARAWYRYA